MSALISESRDAAKSHQKHPVYLGSHHGHRALPPPRRRARPLQTFALFPTLENAGTAAACHTQGLSEQCLK